MRLVVLLCIISGICNAQCSKGYISKLSIGDTIVNKCRHDVVVMSPDKFAHYYLVNKRFNELSKLNKELDSLFVLNEKNYAKRNDLNETIIKSQKEQFNKEITNKTNFINSLTYENEILRRKIRIGSFVVSGVVATILITSWL